MFLPASRVDGAGLARVRTAISSLILGGSHAERGFAEYWAITSGFKSIPSPDP